MPADDRPTLFIDVEASSLQDGFPVEVAWCSADLTRGATYLIRPDDAWLETLDWSEEAESMHGLTLDRLTTEGRAAADVAERLAADLGGQRVESDNPRADAAWLGMLYDALPFTVCKTRPSGVPAVTMEAGLRPHRALDDAVSLAMGFISFDVPDDARLSADSATDRGRELIRRAGRE